MCNILNEIKYTQSDFSSNCAGSSIDIYDSLFLNSYFTQNGGSIHINDDTVQLNFHRSLIFNSKSITGGGGMWARVQDSFLSRICIVNCSCNCCFQSFALENNEEAPNLCNFNHSTVIFCPETASGAFYLAIFDGTQTFVSDNISECFISSSIGLYDANTAPTALFLGVTVANNIGVPILYLLGNAANFSKWNLFNNSAPPNQEFTTYFIHNEDSQKAFTECVFLQNNHTTIDDDNVAIDVTESFFCSNRFYPQSSFCTNTFYLCHFGSFLCETYDPRTERQTRSTRAIKLRLFIVLRILYDDV
jgi:hypothetical protein